MSENLTLEEIDARLQNLFKQRAEITGEREYLLLRNGQVESNFWVLEPFRRESDVKALQTLIENTKDPFQKEYLTSWLLENTDYSCVMHRDVCKIPNSRVCCAMCDYLSDCIMNGNENVCDLCACGVVLDIDDCREYHESLP